MKKILALWGVLLAVEASPLQSAPFISSLSRTYGVPNDPNFLFVHGSGFSPGTLVVRLNGVAVPAGIAEAGKIQVTIAANVPFGSNPVEVRVSNVSAFSSENFAVIGPGPYITGFSPTVGNSGTEVTITGAHFLSGGANGTLRVKFTGANAVTVTSGDGVNVKANAPAGVTSGPIMVYNALGTNVSTGSFLVPPGISGFSPTTGRAGTNVVITGTNLLGATSVQFNNLNAPDFSVLSNGAIRASVPVGATTGRIRVAAPAGFYETSSNFIVQPTINGFTPGFGPANTSVTVFGANFTVGAPVVLFNGVQASAPTNVTFGQLTAIVPAGATTGPISVTTSNGTATSAAKFYLPAIITGVEPIFGSFTVVISGTNFTDTSEVRFNGLPAGAPPNIQNNNSISAVVPFNVTSGPISVTTPAGTFSNANVKFYAPPSIGNFDPRSGLPGTNVTIVGLNFLDASAVLFNGANAAFTVTNNSTIIAIVPTNATTGPITVIAPAGSNTTPVNFVLDYAADVAVTASDSPDPVVVSSNVTYSIVVSNAGPFVAPGVTLTDTLIGPATLKAAATTQGTLNTNGFPITGALGDINVGSSVTVTLTVTAQSPGMINNIATVASLYPDPSPGNNSVTNTTYVQPLPLLSIRRFGADQVRINWPAALTNYGLEFKPLLEPTPPWSSLTNLPIIVGSEYQLTETNNEAMRYYRLRRLP